MPHRPNFRALCARAVAVALAGGAVLALPAGAASAAEADISLVNGSLALSGHGYGHGRGLSQYGARGAASKGLSADAILDFYYPGTKTATTAQPLRVKLDAKSSGGAVRISATKSGGVRVVDEGDGSSYVLSRDPMFRVVRRGDGRTQLQTTDNKTYWYDAETFSGRARFEPVNGASVRVHYTDGSVVSYRGKVVAESDGSGLFPVNHVGLEDYLYGVVPAEMPASWAPAAVQAQSVAARTYAVSYKRTRGKPTWDICSTTTCQVYGGIPSEHSAATAAVRATAGRYRTYAGVPANTEFSSSNGGWSTAGGAYIVARQDPYDALAGNPVHSWTTSVSAARLAAAYPTIGTPRAVRVAARDGRGEWGGRVTSIVVVGSKGSVTVTGDRFRSATGIRSTYFTPTGPSVAAVSSASAISTRWAALGGSGGVLGAATSEEVSVPGGRMRAFQRGHLYSSGAGTFVVNGAILGRYTSGGGPASGLGMPVGDEEGAASGRRSRFAGAAGAIYWSARTGARAVIGGVRGAWEATGGAGGVMGFPVTEEQDTPGYAGGRMSRFERGVAVWTSRFGAHVVLGAVHGAWVAGGGTAGVGVPVAAEEPAGADGRRQRFDRAGGAVYWSPSTGAYHVLGGVRGAWEATGGADGVMGFPVSAEHDTPGYAGGRQSRFQRGTAVWSPRYGAHVVLGAVHGAWAAGGGTAGVGVPVSAEEAAGSGGRKQAFSTAGGVIYWSPTTGAHRVLGAIRTRYDSLGGPTSRLGYPTTEEYPVPGGRATRFEHGTLTWSSSTGKVTAAYVAG